MLLLSAASFILFAAAPDTALAYAEAQARAEKYEDDAAASNFRTTVLHPALGKAIRPIFDGCGQGVGPVGRPNFTVVLSYKGGRFEAVRHTSDNPVAQCVADRLGRIDWPKPPQPDFAEEIHLEMSPQK